jgi:hypothetical protein
MPKHLKSNAVHSRSEPDQPNPEHQEDILKTEGTS